MPWPMHAPCVLVTREDPTPLAEAVVIAGGEPVLLPLLQTRWLAWSLPMGRVLDDYEWVAFTSVRGLETVARAAEKFGWSWPPEARAAAVGDRTSCELQAQGWMPECVAPEGSAQSLVDALRTAGVFGAQILLPCSALAEPTLADGLRQAGASVDVVATYTMEPVWAGSPEHLALMGRDLRDALARGCIVSCASTSAVRALVDLAGAAGVLDALRRGRIAVLGPTTAAAARALGLQAEESDGRSLACLARKAVALGASG